MQALVAIIFVMFVMGNYIEMRSQRDGCLWSISFNSKTHRMRYADMVRDSMGEPDCRLEKELAK